MKKLFLLITVAFAFSLMFIQCGGKNSKDANLTDSIEVESDDEGNSLTWLQQVDQYIGEGDYASAYSLVEPHLGYSEANYPTHERILKNEIADLIAADNNGDNAVKIEFVILERAKYNSFESYINKDSDDEEKQIKKMREFSISLAKASGNDALVKKLTR